MMLTMEIPVVFGREGHRLIDILHTGSCREKGPGVVFFYCRTL